MVFYRTSGCALGKGRHLVFLDSDTHHFPAIWGCGSPVTNLMTVIIIQGCILLTTLQDPHQQEKKYFCHYLSFKMTEMAEGFKQLSMASWYTTSTFDGIVQSLPLVLWQNLSHWWVSHHQSLPTWWGNTEILCLCDSLASLGSVGHWSHSVTA